MRILVISNFYPPHFIGGYELGCKDVVDGLTARGHQVKVLTSFYGLDHPERKGDIYRCLATDFARKRPGPVRDGIRLLKKEIRNRRALEDLCREFQPEVVYIWNATHISISMIFLAQVKGLPTCYFISDYWLSEWESDSWYSQVHRDPRRLYRKLLWTPVKAVLKASDSLVGSSLELTSVQFASEDLKRRTLAANRPVSGSEVIHWGIDTQKFTYNKDDREPCRLLYVGQLTAHKGIDTAINAFKQIADLHKEASLTLVGGPDYDERVHGLVKSLRLDGKVHFAGLLPRDDLPAVYREHDILLFPSSWEEPFSLTLLEAMSSGLAVVSTVTGGSREILKPEVNSLVFPKDNPAACAQQISRLLQDPALHLKLRHSGRKTVEESFELKTMLDRVDRSLQDLALNRSK